MTYTLNALLLFRRIEVHLNAITPDDLAALKPGPPMPDGAEVIRELSPTLKALLCISQKMAEAAIQMNTEATLGPISEVNLDPRAEIARLYLIAVEVAHYLDIFKAALQAEFPEHEASSLRWGQKFEVYKLPPRESGSSDLPDSGEVLIISMFN